MSEPLRVGIIGMGGFAGQHHEIIFKLEQAGLCRLIGACDPKMAGFAARQTALRFAERGVRCFTDYREMLRACRETLDVVTIPTPVPLHAAMHRAAVEAGLAVYLEKPPTLSAAELEEMLAVEARAARATNVGFNFIVDPLRQRMKTRLVAGEFGALRRVVIHALWPRTDAYFARAAWAGRLRLHGQLVLDSCMGNAMAHQAHNGLFWGGSGTLWQWGEVESVTAELYRGHAIEGADTIFVRAELTNGPVLDVVMTHACDGEHTHGEVVECENATLTYLPFPSGPTQCTIAWRDGRRETAPPADMDYTEENFRVYFAYLRGEMERPMTRLIDSRPFVHLNSLAYLAAGRIANIPEAYLTRSQTADGATLCAINSIASIADSFITTGAFPSAQGIAWAVPGGQATVEDFPRLGEVVEEMIGVNSTARL